METGDRGSGGNKLMSRSLGEILRIKKDDAINNIGPTTAVNGDRKSHPDVTLTGVLSDKRGQNLPLRVQSNRTLADIMREESGGGGADRDGNGTRWQLKLKLRLRHQGVGSSLTSNVRIPISDISSRRPSTRLSNPPESTQPETRSISERNNSATLIERGSGRLEHPSLLTMRLQSERNDEVEHGGDGEEEEVRQPAARTSLMALLAETDRQMGLDGSAHLLDVEDSEESSGGGGGGHNSCCVCMVRHKGAAFIPCGHTFCRMCSRELWVQRRNCPLCNNRIVEILDIF